MNILVPSAPDFQTLDLPGVTFTPYHRDMAALPDAHGLVLWNLPREPRRAAMQLPSMQWVLTLTAGVDHIVPDLPQNVRLYNAHALHDDTVAQHAAATILAAARGLQHARDAQRERAWKRRPDLWNLTEKRVVIWGYGHIGRKVENLLTPFGARVTGLRSTTPEEEVKEALAQADVVVLLLPSTPKTRGVVDAALMAQLKPGAWIANYGRGELIVTNDLIAALKSGDLGGAILDVTDPEPLPADSELWAFENVIITPHVGSSTSDMMARAAKFTLDFVNAVRRGEDLGNAVDLTRGY